jgi:hypothetical protein
MRLLEPRDRHQLPSPGTSLLGLAEHAPEDSIEPRPDFGCIPKLVQSEPRPAARLLNRVLRVGAHIGAPRGEREETIEIGKHERVEARVPFGERGTDRIIPEGADLL